MIFFHAAKRLMARSWLLCLTMAISFTGLTAVNLLIGRADWVTAQMALAAAMLVGIAFGIGIASIARSPEGDSYSSKLSFDAFGVSGAVAGFLLGGLIGSNDTDGQFDWLWFENDALVAGCIIGLLTGAVSMAILGEMVVPSCRARWREADDT